jgi:ATP-dependent Clp protease ATP-binding subunit ClpE
MAKCVICKKNLAVVFTTRFENGQRVNEGLCLKCAYKTGLGGMDELFSKAGITDSNIDELTDRMNQVMSQVDGQSPENLFQSLLSGNFDLSAISSNFDPELSDGDDSTEKNSELQPASGGQDSNEVSDMRSPPRG